MEQVLGRMLVAGAGTAGAARQAGLGCAESGGRRPNSEDSVCGGAGWAAVLDGHGGRNAALLGSVVLADEAPKNGATCLGLRSALATVHRLIVRTKLRAGTTAVLAAVQEEQLLVGWVGDSRAVLLFSHEPLDGVAGGGWLRLTEDHRPSNESEARRVLAAGGKISSTSSGSRELRINGELGVTRALGDCDYEKWGLVHEAEARAVRRTLRDAWLVLGCDGLWDVLSESMASAAALRCSHPQQLADRLVSLAYARGSDDNITCAVLDVRPPPLAPGPAVLLTQTHLGLSVPALLSVLLSPRRGLALHALGSLRHAFSAASLVDLLCALRPGLVSRAAAVAVACELDQRGHIRHEHRAARFADEESQVWRLCDELQEKRLRLGLLPTAKLKGLAVVFCWRIFGGFSQFRCLNRSAQVFVLRCLLLFVRGGERESGARYRGMRQERSRQVNVHKLCTIV
jgi:serine/threonine protein phosphatase PrpC